jgi:hypothetical protein
MTLIRGDIAGSGLRQMLPGHGHRWYQELNAEDVMVNVTLSRFLVCARRLPS